MATKTWNGSDTSWNTAGNWSPSGVPSAGDDVVFDATSVNNCTLDVTPNALGSLDVQAGYTGTLDLNDESFTVSDASSTGDVTFANGGGAIKMGTGTLTVAGDYDNTAATGFAHENGTVKMTGTAKTFAGHWDGRDHYAFEVAAGATISLAAAGSSPQFYGPITIDGELDLNGEEFESSAASNVITVGASGLIKDSGGNYLTIKNKTSGTPLVVTAGGAITCDVRYVACTTPSLLAAITYGGNLTISGSGKTAKPEAGPVVVAGALTLTDSGAGLAIDNSNNPDWNIGGSLSQSGTVTWTAGSGTITIDGSGNQAIDFGGLTIDNLVVANTGGTVTFSSGWTAASFDASAGTIDFSSQAIETTGDFLVEAGVAVDVTGIEGCGITVGGDCSLNGQAGNLLDLAATILWSLDVAGTGFASYVDVDNCDASGSASPVVAVASTDEGNNTNWVFAGGPSDSGLMGLGLELGV